MLRNPRQDLSQEALRLLEHPLLEIELRLRESLRDLTRTLSAGWRFFETEIQEFDFRF